MTSPYRSIICAVDEWVEFTLLGHGNCSGSELLTHSLWDDLSIEIFDFLTKISIGDLIRRGERKKADKAAHLSVVSDEDSRAA
ncbi:hypothetical protein [endosymbiont of Lamellibrachia barhami]|uniref:hypothetical protein n=1 Tax=endosymbiont of Lamellibrachia barhami TaxID=205975 RepID=UPI0015B1E9A8